MENASKALIIAGAILISIIIIGLGVYFVNMAQEAGRSVNLDKQVLEAHNNPFEAYLKNSASATEVKTLIGNVRSNNLATSDDADDSTLIYLGFNATKDGTEYTWYGKGLGALNTLSGLIRAGKTYRVTTNDNNDDTLPTGDKGDNKIGSYYKSGYIKLIYINQN